MVSPGVSSEHLLASWGAHRPVCSSLYQSVGGEEVDLA